MSHISVKSALISVYHKKNIEPLLEVLAKNDVTIYSTGGTRKFIEESGLEVKTVEGLTGYPSIFKGRVKTLHPKVMGGILFRRNDKDEVAQAGEYDIPSIDLVVVDLYPFGATLSSGASHEEIIEKIDIGGISLIRAAAKNYNDVLIVSSMTQYDEAVKILSENNCSASLEQRRKFATYAFSISSHYDTEIFNYFNTKAQLLHFKKSISTATTLRYGENPHQEGVFYGALEEMLTQLHGKAISYNNLVDIDAAIALIEEFAGDTVFAILKHTNACGVANGKTVKEAYLKAFEADTVSAFGGVLIANSEVNKDAASEINKLFFEILVAPGFGNDALEILKSKKNRILLVQTQNISDRFQFKSILNGVIQQERDLETEGPEQFSEVTRRKPTADETAVMVFANKIVKHTKSNAIVLARNGQMIASGVGQTSRVDAVKQAISKARAFGFDVTGAVMASDAFFPFADSAEIALNAGIYAIVQPGGSVRDEDTVKFCNEHDMTMVFTGKRHFKH